MNKLARMLILTAMVLWPIVVVAQVQLPSLEVIPADDWVNAKESVEPAAVGDGIADDTAALQAALNRMHGLGESPKVVYIPPGVYRITDTLVMPSSVGSMIIGHGADTRIVWDGRTDHVGSEPPNLLSALRQNPNFPDNPDESEIRSPEFIELDKRGDNYGERVTAYIRAPQTGDYTFWVAGDDNCEVRLSTSANADGAKLICSVPGWTMHREWNKYPEQKSVPVRLQAGQFYYVEILHKEASGGAHVSLGWQLPDGTRETPMPVSRVHESADANARNAFRYQFWKDPEPRLSRMIWSNGSTNATYRGIVWDGNGKALIGFHHNARDRFETANIHEYEAYVNCREAGVKMGPQRPFATAETEFRNCIFADSETGLYVTDFNYYNIAVDGCLFRRNAYGIRAERHGQVYVRNCRFEGNSKQDLNLGPSHKHAVRRCVSVGSNAFIEGSHVTIQDCRVSSWKDPAGAIILNSAAAPVMVFDCVFENPPSNNPPIRVTDANLQMIVSNNKYQRANTLLTGTRDVITVPPGKLGGAISPTGFELSFEPPEPPLKLFDAVRDFGAGTGQDQTAAVQAAIDAAREYGKGAVAYFPPRRYRIAKSIEITGADYTIAGTGYHTEFQWSGPEGGVVFSIVDPQNITIRAIQILGHSVPRDILGIRQTSTGQPSMITYDNVRACTHGGGYRTDDKETVRGIEFVNLGDQCRVNVKRIFASGAFINSTAADILLRFWDGGPIIIENPGGAPRTGFLGGLNANHGGEIIVRDSLDAVFTEYYNEQGEDGLIQLSGKPGDAPGRFTIGAARLHLWEESPFFAEIDGYRGQFTYAHGDITWDRSPQAYLIRQKCTTPFTLVMLAHNNFRFDIQLNPAATAVYGANRGVRDSLPQAGLAAISNALDHWRLLGLKDIEFRNATDRK